MICRGFLLSFMLLAPEISASEIMAWKIPLSRFGWSDTETEGVEKMESPPQPSPFFKVGDELWDLSAVHEKGKNPPLDWIVWNATSERIVAKGTWDGISQLHEILDGQSPPRNLRIRLETFKIPSDGSLPSKNALPALELSVIVRSALKFKVSNRERGESLEMSGQAVLGNLSNPVVDVQVSVLCQLKDQPRLDLNTSFSLEDNGSIWVARDFHRNQGIDLRVTPTFELPDGTPLKEFLMKQNGDAIEPFVIERNFGRKNAGNGWLEIIDLPRTLLDPPGPTTGDPFAVSELPAPVALNLPDILPPAFLSEWVDHSVLDVSTLVRTAGVAMDREGDFAGYDPIQQKLFIYSTGEALVNICKQIYSGHGETRETLMVTLETDGETKIVTHSGSKASLTRSAVDNSIVRSVEVEPNMGAEISDLTLKYQVKSEGREELIQTSTTIPSGKFSKVFSGGSGEGTEFSLSTKVEMLPR